MAEGTKKRFPARVYQAVWRWHFWAGLLVTPALVAVAVTGAIYAFKPQIEPQLYPEFFQSSGTAVVPEASFDAFQAEVREALPGRRLAYIQVHDNVGRNWEGYARQTLDDGTIENLRVFYDPTTAEYLGYQDYNHTFFRVVLNIHRTLLGGLPGRLVVEAATCWGVVTMLSGLYLWWPRKKEKLWGVWLPRVRGAFRTVLRDWHTVPGVYISIILIAIMVTGLLFTRIWGTAYLAVNAATGGFPEFYTEHPHSSPPEDGAELSFIGPDAAFAEAARHYPYADQSFLIAIPEAGSDDAFEISTDLQKPLDGLAVTFVDAFSGATLLHQTGEGVPWRTHLTLLFYPIHTGFIGGITTQVIAAAACLLLIVMSVTGVWLWWRRKPAGKLAAPGRPPPETVPGWIAWTTVGLAVFLPTVGLTLLAIWLASCGMDAARRLKAG